MVLVLNLPTNQLEIHLGTTITKHTTHNGNSHKLEQKKLRQPRTAEAASQAALYTKKIGDKEI